MFTWGRILSRGGSDNAKLGDRRGHSDADSTKHDGSLEGVPSIHTHRLCGASTLIDEEVLRGYLALPLLAEDQVYCAGCRDHFHAGEFTWDATGESVLDYLGRLRRDYLRRVYSLRLMDRTGGVIVLPAAATVLKAHAKQRRWDKFYLSLKLLLDGSFAVQLVDVRHRVTETHIDAAVPIVLERDQVARMQGLVVEHRQGYGELDIVVTRLHS